MRSSHTARKSSPLSPQLEKAHVQQRPDAAKNKLINFKKSLQIINSGEGVEKREPSYTVDANVNWYSHYGEEYGGSSRK